MNCVGLLGNHGSKKRMEWNMHCVDLKKKANTYLEFEPCKLSFKREVDKDFFRHTGIERIVGSGPALEEMF